MDKNLRGMVIGAGYMGRNHIRILRSFEDVTVVGVVEPRKEAAKSIRRMYGITIFSSLDEALDKNADIDFINIAAPTSLHFSLAKKCLGKKIMTFIEKPITEKISQAEELIRMSRRYRTPVMVGHIERFNPGVMELKKRLKRGELGKVFQIWADRLGPFPGRISDVGVVIDLATHDLDMFEYLLEDQIVKVTARVERFFHPGHEDFLMGMVDFRSGTRGMLNVNWITPRKVRRLCVTGEMGMFILNYVTQELSLYKNNASRIKWEQMEVFKAVSEGDVVKIKIEYQEPLALELRAFITSIRKKQPAPVPIASALRALRLANMTLRSGKTGKSIVTEI